MIDIVTRIHQIIQEQQLSSAAFADAIGVQRSSISHVLSGRNKPSLDFVLKTLQAFPQVSPQWLLLGIDSPTLSPHPQDTQVSAETDRNTESYVSNSTTPAESAVEKIVFFYKDGSFQTYRQKD